MKSYISKSIKHKDGRVLYFTASDFITEIVEKNACFICGKLLEDNPQNKEHIIPNWILKTYKLHSRHHICPK
jgi:hypothetical protein